MRAFLVILYIAVALIVIWRYLLLAKRGQTEPALATWVLFGLGVTLSFVTYLSFEQHALADNIANTTDLGFVGIMIAGLLILHKGSRRWFTPFEWGCVAAAVAIGIIWLLEPISWQANAGLQVIMTVAYFPTLRQLHLRRRNTEDFTVWYLALLDGAITLTLACMGRNPLGILYAVRVIACEVVLIGFMRRAAHHEQQQMLAGCRIVEESKY